MRNIVTTVYPFDELSEDAKDTAVAAVREKLAGSWWDFSDVEDIGNTIVYAFAGELGSPGAEEYGPADFPGVSGVTLKGWSSAPDYAVFHGTLTRDNAPKLPWKRSIEDVRCKSARYGTRIDANLTDNLVPPGYEDEIEQAVRDAVYTALRAGLDEIEYKSSEEVAREWCENNEVQEYLIDGQLAD